MKAARLTCGEEAGSKSGRERRETGQRDRSGRRNWRQVRETGLGEGTGDRSECLPHFNTAAVTELVHVKITAVTELVHVKITAVTECTLTQQR